MLLALRLLLIFDAAVLALLGGAFAVVPARVLEVFKFEGVPTEVHYIVAMWGCVMFSMALGYLYAAMDPFKHVVWIQVAIARTGIEFLVGMVYLGMGVVTWSQAGFGVVMTGLIALAFVLLYPRPSMMEGAP